jgi:hypothetical protein
VKRTKEEAAQEVPERRRSERAREREARALQHMREADLKAAAAGDAQSASLHHHEAEVHARAAKLHRQASELQERHERESTD